MATKTPLQSIADALCRPDNVWFAPTQEIAKVHATVALAALKANGYDVVRRKHRKPAPPFLAKPKSKAKR